MQNAKWLKLVPIRQSFLNAPKLSLFLYFQSLPKFNYINKCNSKVIQLANRELYPVNLYISNLS